MSRRCQHDGAHCHHSCPVPKCFRHEIGAVLSTPHPGYPREPNIPQRTLPWRDAELIWHEDRPYAYRTLLGSPVAVYLAGGHETSYAAFMARRPSAIPPREVRR